MNDTDVTTADPSALTDIQDIKIDAGLPKEERIKQYLKQTNGNPYFFMCDGIVIEMCCSDTDLTINDALESYLSNL